MPTASAVAAKFIQPLSPPQSNNGDLAPPLDFQPMYDQQNTFGINGLHSAVEAAYDNRKSQTMIYSSSPSVRYISNGDYSHIPPAQHTMESHNLHINTPPHAPDDELVPEYLDSTPLQWPSAASGLKRGSGKTRVHRTPKVRQRKKKSKSTKDATKDANRDWERLLPDPLSVVTQHLTHVPLKDMKAWVNRPIDVRHQEAEKRGKIARPMNSFMLYRSAYADRAKEWFRQNNHQVVSEVAGFSWKKETRETREDYEHLANIEKVNHLQAHPGYKFSPSKDKTKRSGPDVENTYMDDLENSPDPETVFFHPRTQSTTEILSDWGSRNPTPFEYIEHGLPSGNYIDSWQTSNPTNSVPGMMSSPGPAQYLRQPIQQNLMSSHVENAHFKKAELQGFEYPSSTPLAGLPGAAHHDLLQPPPSVGTGHNGQVDPQLLSIQNDTSNSCGGNQLYPHPHYTVWQADPDRNCYIPIPTLPPVYQVEMQPLVDAREVWVSSKQEPNVEEPVDYWINHSE